ncbi:hypothetical protein ADIARSV_1252 [Arcticibacter svalbardensis MN12-7]|uniref:Uncharacterized protein n=1 Tax=Arcticibacter svalbardensis MN12-7 TaxID=1150600 RepID=R9H300_9SPHI|nr:hypothetical protein [Arcticibacter svalbardensis]EOR95569.1 hypothetical protein ADIARSV_1252 [Arcticibacter svalbardensis MN12-7]
MKKIFYLSIMTFISVFTACKNPADDIRIIITPNVFNYTTAIKVDDAAGNALPSNLVIEIAGPDAGAVYTPAGNKSFTVQDGYIYMGIDPHKDPTSGSPLEFNVKVSGDAILNVNIPFTITAGQGYQLKPIKILNINNPPSGASVNKPSFSVATLATQDVTISTNTTTSSLVSTMNIYTGTQFLNAAGQVLSGDRFTSVLVNLDPSTQAGIALFPGGSLTSEAIVNAAGQTISGTFVPAAITDIEFYVNDLEVKGFSKDVMMIQDINPSYINPKTGAIVKVGDLLEIFSYEVTTGIFKFERTASVISHNNGKLAVTYPINHLTAYIAGYVEGACSSSSLQLNATWMTQGVSYPLNIKFMNAQNQVIQDQILNVSSTNTLIPLPVVPTGTSTLIITHSSTGAVLFNGSVTVNCGSVISATLTSVAQQPIVTMQLFVRCPGQTVTVSALPTFQLYYRLTGSNASFLPLGEVVKGYISTTSLDVTKRYDFRGIWESTPKTVGDKAIVANNSTTVGDGVGENLGQYDSVNNLDMLKQACASIGQ